MTSSVLWKPHPGQQTKFCRAWQDEVLFGGAAGPGKTDCLIVEALRYVQYPSYNALILRRTFPQLQEIIDRTHRLYPAVGGEYRSVEHRWYFPSGATINLGHMHDSLSQYQYQGKEFQYIGFDEAGQFLPKQYLYLFSRLRTTDPRIKLRFRSATNPGGPCHQFLKDRFQISNVEPESTILDPETGMTRVFIPAKIQDNPSLIENDPLYVRRLMQLPEIERMRLMEGIWDAFEGQVFSELNREIHGVDPFPLPPEWNYFRSFDWGYSKPWCCHFWASDFDGRLYVVKTLYGAKQGDTSRWEDLGMKQSDAEIAREIRKAELELGVKVHPGPACKSTFARKSPKGGVLGPPPAEEMLREGVSWIQGDHDRLAGKRQVHQRLRVDEEGSPSLYIFNDNEVVWTLLPLMQEDPKNPEDVWEKQPHDHVYEALRLGLMWRPLRPRKSGPSDAGSFQAERRKYLRARQLATQYGVSMSEAYQKVR